MLPLVLVLCCLVDTSREDVVEAASNQMKRGSRKASHSLGEVGFTSVALGKVAWQLTVSTWPHGPINRLKMLILSLLASMRSNHAAVAWLLPWYGRSFGSHNLFRRTLPIREAHPSEANRMWDVLVGDPCSTVPARAGACATMFWKPITDCLGADEEQKLEFEEVLDTMRADIPKMLRKPPYWILFARDITVVDQTGARLEGLENNIKLWRLLHRIHRRFVVKEDVRVGPLTYDSSGCENPWSEECVVDPRLVAEFKLQYYGVRRPFFRMRPTGFNFPIDIEGEASFHFNDMNQVASVSIDKLLVNGRVSQSWPDLRLSYGPATIFERIQEWSQDIQPMNRTELGIKTTIHPVEREAPDFSIERKSSDRTDEIKTLPTDVVKNSNAEFPGHFEKALQN